MAELQNTQKLEEGNGSGPTPAVSEGDINLNKSRDPIVVEAGHSHKSKGAITRDACDSKSLLYIFGIVLVALLAVGVIALVLIIFDTSAVEDVLTTSQPSVGDS